ncbi:TPA: baseplate assembly protein [Klebsiella pneumoniae]|uniref:baseplate assembly protein n=1 Tax=Klebsiella pneumoniae TaxID=573 RepID=UPI001090F231|nr:baseplate assembly protein [Klebsiella pneumoniae]HDU4462277.1 baseplate assembly protein [Klebsiella pneumoniae subsp. pneumoniae]QRT40079.1 baseplate assembly protein [Klebsiella pneumoniae]VGG52965.1 Baseplate assembly protein J [Klebsiella pneumoniae]HBX7876193.1 baseplate assembly protein [Klebsiella pneumoniae]HBY4009594.1 baseplate assembly protein [Klebsiella pneumoniae]
MAVIDLSQLPAPEVIEVLDYETIFEERKATLISLYPEDEQEAIARTLSLESDPIVKILQENAYREVILRQRVNEAAQAGMVAYAIKNDLDQLAANNNVERLTITPADDSQIPPAAAEMESDSDLRQRIPAAFEGMSVAGPTGAYEFHAMSADGRVADSSAISPAPAEVIVAVLARQGDGTASEDLLQAVSLALNDEAVRPVGDRLTVVSADIVYYSVDAVLFVYPGPATEPILAAAKAQLATYINAQRRLGRDIRRSAIYAALHVQGVQRVELSQPLADVVLDKTQAAYCTDYNVIIGGSDE